VSMVGRGSNRRRFRCRYQRKKCISGSGLRADVEMSRVKTETLKYFNKIIILLRFGVYSDGLIIMVMKFNVLVNVGWTWAPIQKPRL
jgi:hypothetical protein